MCKLNNEKTNEFQIGFEKQIQNFYKFFNQSDWHKQKNKTPCGWLDYI